MSSNGNAIDRQEAISHLQKAEEYCIIANEAIVTLSGGLTGLAQSIVGEPGSGLVKNYHSMANGIAIANEAMIKIKDVNINLANLINTSSSSVSGGAPAIYNTGSYRKTYPYTEISSKKAGIKDPGRALEVIDNAKKQVTSLQTNLQNAIKEYKTIWSLADEAKDVREQAHKVANDIRTAMRDFSESLSKFSHFMKTFMEESLSDSQKRGSLTGEQVALFNAKLGGFQYQVQALPAAWGDHYID